MEDNQLKNELILFFHELMGASKEIICQGDYHHLLNLCEQDIAILVLLSHKESSTAKNISIALNAPKTTIGSAISRLVKRGYIVRQQNECDKREQDLFLTENGKELIKEHDRYEELYVACIMNCFEKQDQDGLTKILANRKKIKYQHTEE